MNYLNNHFQKGIIVIVVAMLLTIQNMRVHSFIGSYQTSSLAITINNNYKKHTCSIEKLMYPAVVMVAKSVAVGLGVLASIGAFLYIVVSEVKSLVGKSFLPLTSDFFDDYDKYDFSKFDN